VNIVRRLLLSMLLCASPFIHAEDRKYTSAFAPRISYTKADELMMLVCDPSKTAPFAKDKPDGYCMMMFQGGVTYMRETDQPCADTPKGNALRKLLGPKCDDIASLQVRKELFRLTRSCDETDLAKQLEPLLGVRKCLFTYELERPPPPPGMHYHADGTLHEAHSKTATPGNEPSPPIFTKPPSK
jgi:hypothetical protein